MNQEELDIRLLAFWQEELSGQEKQEVLQWLQADPEHLSYYQTLKKTYWRQRWVVRQSSICRKSERRYRKLALRKRFIRRCVAVAASICLLLGGAIGYWWSQSLRTSAPVTVVESILPGSSKAKLYLSSGEEILLAKESQSISEQQMMIEVNEGGSLSYQGINMPQQEEVIYNRLVVERGGEYKLQLSDGSEIWINSGTELEYPVCFNDERRLVKMKGEAYFKVKSDSLRPFVVQVNGIEVTAMGTEFSINSYSAQYVKSVLVQGKIGVGAKGEPVILKPNQLAVYDCATHRTEVKDVDVRKYIDWKTGDFIFSNDPLEEVMEKIALWYDCQVVFTSKNLKEMKISGNMKRYAHVDTFLHYLRMTTGAQFETKNKTIYIYE